MGSGVALHQSLLGSFQDLTWNGRIAEEFNITTESALCEESGLWLANIANTCSSR